MRRTRSISAGSRGASRAPLSPPIARSTRVARTRSTPGAKFTTRFKPPLASPMRAIAAVYDDYPAMVLVQLEDLGFAGGSVKELVGRVAGGALAVNTSGGQLSAGQAGAAGGLHGVVEATLQLRGEAGERQVLDARAAAVTGYGMVAYRHGACANAAVLEAGP